MEDWLEAAEMEDWLEVAEMEDWLEVEVQMPQPEAMWVVKYLKDVHVFRK